MLFFTVGTLPTLVEYFPTLVGNLPTSVESSATLVGNSPILVEMIPTLVEHFTTLVGNLPTLGKEPSTYWGRIKKRDLRASLLSFYWSLYCSSFSVIISLTSTSVLSLSLLIL